jgi:hypothetical protein
VRSRTDYGGVEFTVFPEAVGVPAHSWLQEPSVGRSIGRYSAPDARSSRSSFQIRTRADSNPGVAQDTAL